MSAVHSTLSLDCPLPLPAPQQPAQGTGRQQYGKQLRGNILQPVHSEVGCVVTPLTAALLRVRAPSSCREQRRWCYSRSSLHYICSGACKAAHNQPGLLCRNLCLVSEAAAVAAAASLAAVLVAQGHVAGACQGVWVAHIRL
jgi:hypothetical protein